MPSPIYIHIFVPIPYVYVNIVEEEKIPESCRAQTYCTIKLEDYPEERYKEMIKDLKPPIVTPHAVPDELTYRYGDPNDKDDCESEVKYELMYYIRSNVDSEWHPVIQVPTYGYLQVIRQEKCKDTTASCFKQISSGIPDVVTYCKQVVSSWALVIDDGNNGSREETVNIPTCCKCAYRKIWKTWNQETYVNS